MGKGKYKYRYKSKKLKYKSKSSKFSAGDTALLIDAAFDFGLITGPAKVYDSVVEGRGMYAGLEDMRTEVQGGFTVSNILDKVFKGTLLNIGDKLSGRGRGIKIRNTRIKVF